MKKTTPKEWRERLWFMADAYVNLVDKPVGREFYRKLFEACRINLTYEQGADCYLEER